MPARYLLLLCARVLAAGLVIGLPAFAGQLFAWQVLLCALAVGCCALALCGALLLGASGRRTDAVDWLLVAFWGWLVLATVRSVYLHASLLSLLQMASYVALLVLWRHLFGPESWRVGGWAVVAAGGAVAGFLGVRDWSHTAIFQGDVSWRAFGSFYNPNCLAGYCLVALTAAAVTLARAWRSARDPQRPARPRYELILAGFAFLLPAAALLLTASRAGVLGAGLGALVFLLATPGRVPRRWLLVGAAALVLFVVAAPPLRTRLLQATAQSHSALFRWYTWRGTVATIASNPLVGHGPGTFEYAYQRHALTGFTRMAHQTPLQVAAEAGIPAALLLLSAGVVIARRLLAGCQRAGPRAVECAAGLAALAALGFQNLADYTWYVPAVGLTLAAVLALALGAAADGPTTSAPLRTTGVVVAMGLAVVAVGVCVVGLRAQVLAQRGAEALARGSYHVARGWLTQALRLDPLDADIWGDLSQALAGTGEHAGLQAAIEARRRALQLCPLKSGHHLMLALLLDAAGETEQAIAAARRSVELGPNHPRAYANLARLLAQAGRQAEALEVYRQLEQVYQSPVGKYQALTQVSDYAYAEAWVALGQEALRAKDAVGAMRYFEQAAEQAGQYAAQARAQESLWRQIGAWDEGRVLDAERLAAQARLLREQARRLAGREESVDQSDSRTQPEPVGGTGARGVREPNSGPD